MAKIGAQMFTLRDYCKTVDDIARSLERVKAMGYDGIQASAAGFNTLDVEQIKAIRRAADDNGLAIAATHESLDHMRDQPEAVIEKHKLLDCQYTAIGGFGFKEPPAYAAWSAFATEFSAITRKLADAGLAAGYHNHNHELVALGQGRTPLSVLIDECDAHVWFELDVYWVAAGLGDPAAWINKVAGRIPCIHYKDGSVMPDRSLVMKEVGGGNLNWPAINAASKAAGVEWYLVERDSGELDPFESLEISIKQMRDWGL